MSQVIGQGDAPTHEILRSLGAAQNNIVDQLQQKSQQHAQKYGW